MDFDSFLGYVQNRAQFGSTGEALQATRITLTTLSERIQPGEADDLAAQLPREIDRFLSEVDTVEAFSFEEFVELRQVREQLPAAEGWAELFEIADQEESVSPSE